MIFVKIIFTNKSHKTVHNNQGIKYELLNLINPHGSLCYTGGQKNSVGSDFKQFQTQN